MIIVIFLSLIIDLYLNYYLPFLPSFFSYLKPLLFITTIIIFIMLEYQNKKKIKFLFAIIIIYDLLFSKVYLLYPVIFIILYKIISYLNKRWNNTFFSFTTIFMLSLIIFISMQYIILVGIGFINQSISFLINQILQSIILNVSYSIILYYFLGIKKRNT